MIRQKLELLKKALEDNLFKAVGGPKDDFFDKLNIPEEKIPALKKIVAHYLWHKALATKFDIARDQVEQVEKEDWEKKKRDRLYDLSSKHEDLARKILHQNPQMQNVFGRYYDNKDFIKFLYRKDLMGGEGVSFSKLLREGEAARIGQKLGLFEDLVPNDVSPEDRQKIINEFLREAYALPSNTGAARRARKELLDKFQAPMRLEDIVNNIDRLADFQGKLKEAGFDPSSKPKPLSDKAFHKQAAEWHYAQGLKKGAATPDRAYHHQLYKKHWEASGEYPRHSVEDFNEYAKQPKSSLKYDGIKEHPYDKELIGMASPAYHKRKYLKTLSEYNDALVDHQNAEEKIKQLGDEADTQDIINAKNDAEDKRLLVNKKLSFLRDATTPLVDSDLIAQGYAKNPRYFEIESNKYRGGSAGPKSKHILHDMKFLENIFEHDPHKKVLNGLITHHYSRLPAKIKRKLEKGENPEFRSAIYSQKDFGGDIGSYRDLIEKEEKAGELGATAEGLFKNPMFSHLDDDEQYNLIKKISNADQDTFNYRDTNLGYGETRIGSPTVNKLLQEDPEKYLGLFQQESYGKHKLEKDTLNKILDHSDPSVRNFGIRNLTKVEDADTFKSAINSLIDRLGKTFQESERPGITNEEKNQKRQEATALGNNIYSKISNHNFGRGHNEEFIAPILKKLIESRKQDKEAGDKIGSPKTKSYEHLMKELLDPDVSVGEKASRAFFKLKNDPKLNLSPNWLAVHLANAPEEILTKNLNKARNFEELNHLISELGIYSTRDSQKHKKLGGHDSLENSNKKLIAAADAGINLYKRMGEMRTATPTSFGMIPTKTGEGAALEPSDLRSFGSFAKELLHKGLPMHKVKELVNSTALPPTAYLMSPDHTSQQTREAFNYYKGFSNWDKGSVDQEVQNLIKSPWFTQDMADHMMENTNNHLNLKDIKKIHDHKNNIEFNHSAMIKNLSNDTGRRSELNEYLEGAKDKLSPEHWEDVVERFKEDPLRVPSIVFGYLPKEKSKEMLTPHHSIDQWNAFVNRDDVGPEDYKEYPTDKIPTHKLPPKVMRTMAKNPEEHPDLSIDNSKLTNFSESIANPAAVEHLKTLLHNNDGQMKWSEIKAKMPQWENLEGIKKAVGNKPVVTLSDVQKNIENAPKKKWHITHKTWSSMQRHNDKNQLVVQLNSSNDLENEMKKNPEEHDVFSKIQRAAYSSSHPVLPHTIGWARVDTSNPKHWFIDEIQSDVMSTLAPDRMSRHFNEEEIGKANRHLKNINEKLGDWHEHLLNHVMGLAQKHGVERISMHSPETKTQMNIGASATVPGKYKEIYGKVPKRAGFKMVPHHEAKLTSDERKLSDPHSIVSSVAEIKDNPMVNTYHLVDRHNMPAGKTLIEPKKKTEEAAKEAPKTSATTQTAGEG